MSSSAQVTVLMTTSPILAHPSTSIIDETIQSVKERLPNALIVVLCDGVHHSLERYADAYRQYVERLITTYSGDALVDVVVHDHFVHQSGMIIRALPHVTTQVVAFIEHDLRLLGDVPVDEIVLALTGGYVDVVRLNINTELEKWNAHMFLGMKPHDVVPNLPCVRVWQWSSTPHFASTAYYRRMAELLKDDEPHYVEEVFIAPPVDAHLRFGDEGGWQQHRIVIYTPPGDQRRILHLDGRGDDEPVR
jgi:hypothetical protein